MTYSRRKLTKEQYLKSLNDRSLPLEDRLLLFYIAIEIVWAIVNLIISVKFQLPLYTRIGFAATLITILVLFLFGFFTYTERIIKEIYFVLFFFSIPALWYVCGQNAANANIFFVAENLVFIMCMDGRKRNIYVGLAMFSTAATQAVSRIIPDPMLVSFDDNQLRVISTAIGLTTTILIISILIRQKYEYARERNAVIESEKALERSNKLQKNFLANMSHEIRSPLGIVLGFNSLISESDDIEQIHEYSRHINHAGKTLQIVINDILDYSKIESGKLDIIDEDYSLLELVEDIKAEIDLKCSEKGLKLEVNCPKNICDRLNGDDIRIKQCLLNILSNAVKYTEKGTVTFSISEISCEESVHNLSFTITDTGRGIDSDTIPNLFDAFQRLDEGTNRSIEGTGLGLAITKNLVDEMNGTIEVTSVKGEGSTFTIYLSQQDAKDTVSESVETAEDAKTNKKLHVLVVDDTKINLVLMGKLLDKIDVDSTRVSSGREALDITKTSKFDLIFLDHMMPDLNGIETFELLKKDNDNLNLSTPVIMLTANAMAGAEKEYKEIGFDAYLSKPIEMSKLEKVINDLR